MNTAKFQPVHAVVANAPLIISILADQSPAVSRFFYGVGAPGAGTLLAGNGKYNGALSGWIISATLQAAGSGYAVGDTLTVGTATITVDAAVAGAIVDFHFSGYGNYSAGSYPANPVATTATSGSGTGATFNFNWPAPDFYIDMTTATAPVLYVCTSAGNATTSVWAKISGGAGGSGWNYRGTFNPSTTYATGDVVFFGSGTSSGLYFSTIDGNTNAPDSGIGWNQLSNGNGTWL
jgi:hypothetical protein